MNTAASNNFRVVEGGLSVNEIMRKSRAAAARRRTMKKVRIAFLIIAFILVGSLLIFSKTVKAQVAVKEDTSVKGYMYITVENNDTLWSIADTYIDSHYDSVYQYIREVKDLNGLTSDSIHSGSKLIIPVYAQVASNN